LDPASAHHVRDVLRLTVGTAIEAFDDAGDVGRGTVSSCDHDRVIIHIEQVVARDPSQDFSLTVASAIPKGDRADWMVEKLSEIGCARWIPLATDRAVVLPAGKNKHDRWARLATESAKQSRRRGVMRVDPLVSLDNLLATHVSGQLRICLSTSSEATSFASFIPFDAASALLFIGPEGGWTDTELSTFSSSGIHHARLTDSILRVETAAVVAAGFFMVGRAGAPDSNSSTRQSPDPIR